MHKSEQGAAAYRLLCEDWNGSRLLEKIYGRKYHITIWLEPIWAYVQSETILRHLLFNSLRSCEDLVPNLAMLDLLEQFSEERHSLVQYKEVEKSEEMDFYLKNRNGHYNKTTERYILKIDKN